MKIQTFYSSYMNDTLKLAPGRKEDCILWCNQNTLESAKENTRGWTFSLIEELLIPERHNTLYYLMKGYNRKTEKTYEKILMLNNAYEKGGLTLYSGCTITSRSMLENLYDYCINNYAKKTSVINKYEIKSNEDLKFNYGFIINPKFSNYMYATMIILEMLLTNSKEFDLNKHIDNIINYPYLINKGMIKYLNVLPYETMLPYGDIKDMQVMYHPFLTALFYEDKDYYKNRQGVMKWLFGESISEVMNRELLDKVVKGLKQYLGLSYYKLTDQDFR